jgi:hypothetical protein
MTEKSAVPGLPQSAIENAAATARAVAGQAREDARELGEAGEEYRDVADVHQRVAVAAAVVAEELERMGIGGKLGSGAGDERVNHE